MLPAILMAALCASMCGFAGSVSGATSSSGTIRTLSVEPTQGLDPNIAATDASRQPMGLMFDSLVDYDESGRLVGALAESYQPSADNKIWTFKLRTNARFSDGSPITAGDVKFSIERMRSGVILKALLSNVSNVSIADATTVKVTLSAPSRELPLILSRLGNAAILSQRAVQSNPNYFTLPTATSGPYVLKSLTPKDRAIFVTNPYYWRAGYPKMNTIEYVFSQDQNSWAAAIESGSADVAEIGYADVQRLKNAGIPVVQADVLAPLFWGWNMSKPPFNNVLVRRAFAYAVDNDGRQAACWFGTGASTYGNILRPWDPNYVQIETYKMDPAAGLQKAGTLLDQAGWKVGSDGIRAAQGVAGVTDGTKFSVTVPYENNWPAAECNTLLLQSTMKKVGVNIIPDKHDAASFWGQVAKNEFIMYHGGARSTGADDLYLNWFHSGGALTPLTTHLNDPAIDRQIDAAVAGDAATAKKIYGQLEAWQAANLPFLVTGHQFQQVAMSPKLKGWYSRPDSFDKWLVVATIGK